MTPEGVGAVRATMRRVERSVSRVSWKDPEDAVQEAAARAVQRGVDLQAEPWLKTVAKRIAIDGVRRKREIASGAPDELEKYVREHDGNPEGVMLRAEASAEVQRALSSISPRYRSALVTYMEEESPAAVARKLGLSPNATWTLLSRARSSLRTALERGGFTPVVIFARDHWRSIVTGAAAAGVAASLAIVPGMHPPKPRAPSSTVTVVQSPAMKTAALKPGVNVSADKTIANVESTVQRVVHEAAQVPVRIRVQGCNPHVKAAGVSWNVWIVQTGPAPGLVASAVPEPLRKTVLTTC